MIVGMRLGSFDSANHQTNSNLFLLAQPSLLIKLIILPIFMLVLSKVFSLSNLMSKALVLQASTPTAISILLLAESTGKEQEVAASLVAWSTLISLVTVPITVFIALKYFS